MAVQKRAGDSSVQPATRQLLPKAEDVLPQPLQDLTTSVKPEQVNLGYQPALPLVVLQMHAAICCCCRILPSIPDRPCASSQA